MSNRARAIGNELAESEEQTEALNASLRRDARRHQIAAEIAAEHYGTDDVEVSSPEDNRGEIAVESVDDGYWVSARVWVSADDVEWLLDKDLTDREWCERYAHLVFNIGTIIEDRQVLSEEQKAKLWAHLRDNTDGVYEMVGPKIDFIEDEVFGEES